MGWTTGIHRPLSNYCFYKTFCVFRLGLCDSQCTRSRSFLICTALSRDRSPELPSISYYAVGGGAPGAGGSGGGANREGERDDDSGTWTGSSTRFC